MHEKWHVAYEEALHVPFVVSSPLLPGGERELDDSDQPRRPAADAARARRASIRTRRSPQLQGDHTEARPLVGRDLSGAIRAAEAGARRPSPCCSPPTMRSARAARTAPSPFQRVARATRTFSTIEQPNHLETVIAEVDVDGEQHLVKFSRYHDNQQFWTVPGERDERLRGARRSRSPSPSPTNTSSTTSPWIPTRNATSPTRRIADERTRGAAGDDAGAARRAARGQAPDARRPGAARLQASRRRLTYLATARRTAGRYARGRRRASQTSPSPQPG